MNRYRNVAGGESRTLEGVAIALTALFTAHALSVKLAPVWQIFCQLFRF